MKLILTCEHGGNIIPLAYQHYFLNQEKLLNSHRGYDPGTLRLFENLKSLADFALSNQVSRLLIEYNRSLNHRALFSDISKNFSSEEKEALINHYYYPYRSAVENKVNGFIQQKEKVVHISLHSFTPVLEGHSRNNDIGLLYDPKRREEVRHSDHFRAALLSEFPALRIRSNYPYLGTADGFTTYLRKQFPENYVGIELEVNQKWVVKNVFPRQLTQAIFLAVKAFQENAH